MTIDMHGRVCLITGGSSGIGKATALELARRGATVVLVSRDPQRGAAAVADIAARTGNQAVQTLVADLSSQAAVRRLAQDFEATGLPLHVLVNNAGAVFAKRTLAADGLEETFALNHLAPFLLTNLLLPTITASGTPGRSARIVTVSSDAHKGASINFDDLQGAKRYRSFGAYAQSKLANVLFTYELARRLAGTQVTANAAHPGFVASGFGKNNAGLLRLAIGLMGVIGKTPEQGAQTPVYVAASTEVEGVSGAYFVDCRAVRSSKQSYDQAVARRLWEVSAALTGIAA